MRVDFAQWWRRVAEQCGPVAAGDREKEAFKTLATNGDWLHRGKKSKKLLQDKGGRAVNRGEELSRNPVVSQ